MTNTPATVDIEQFDGIIENAILPARNAIAKEVFETQELQEAFGYGLETVAVIALTATTEVIHELLPEGQAQSVADALRRLVLKRVDILREGIAEGSNPLVERAVSGELMLVLFGDSPAKKAAA